MKASLNRNHCILNTLIISGTIIYVVLKIILSTGEIQPDSIQYFLQAQNFWIYKINFPLGYAFLIRIFYYVTGSFIIASKIINIFSYLLIIFFSYRKKFFFSETVLVFSFYPLVTMYPISLSEPVYYLFNYLIIYLTYRIVQTGFSKKYICIAGLLFFILVSLRFSGLFVFITSALFLGYVAYKKKYPLRLLVSYTMASAAGIICYLFINYLYCGFLLGQRGHLHISAPPILNFISTVSVSIAKDFSFLHIFIHKGILHKLSFMNAVVGIFTLATGLFIMIRKRKTMDLFSSYLFISFLGILASIIYTYYVTKVDDTIRIKSNAYLYLIFFLAVNSPKIALNFSKIFLVFSLFINFLTLIIYSDIIFIRIKKYKALLCPGNSKIVNLIYTTSPEIENRYSDARILLFKSLLIDRGYKINESERFPEAKASECNIRTSDLVK